MSCHALLYERKHALARFEPAFGFWAKCYLSRHHNVLCEVLVNCNIFLHILLYKVSW